MAFAGIPLKALSSLVEILSGLPSINVSLGTSFQQYLKQLIPVVFNSSEQILYLN
jgi:hypothetical protein